jgi:hypothetical protein
MRSSKAIAVLFAAPALPLPAQRIAIEHVNVVSMRDARVDRDRTVVVRGDRIVRARRVADA